MLMAPRLTPQPMADWVQAYMLWFRGFVDALGGTRPSEEQWKVVLDRLKSYPPADAASPIGPVPYNDPLAGSGLASHYASAVQQFRQGNAA